MRIFCVSLVFNTLCYFDDDAVLYIIIRSLFADCGA